MTQDSIDPSFSEEPNITEFSQNDNLFRTPPALTDYVSVPRTTFLALGGESGYIDLTKNLSRVVMIDLWDVVKYLNIKREISFEAIDIRKIAEIVCDFIGDDAEFHEVLWTSFDEDVSSIIVAQLGTTDLDDAEHRALMSKPFDNAMDVINSAAKLIKAYLINARYPIIEGESIYKVADYKNGIIALQLRTYEELEEDYGEFDNGGDEEEETI